MKSLLGIESAGSNLIAARVLPVCLTSALWFVTLRSCIGTPASSTSSSEMSWPLRISGLRTGGVMREASGTRVVSGAQPVPWGRPDPR